MRLCRTTSAEKSANLVRSCLKYQRTVRDAALEVACLPCDIPTSSSYSGIIVAMRNPTGIVKVAVPQLEPEWLDLEAGIQKSIKYIKEAAENGSQLIAFSECWIPGYPSFLWSYNFKSCVSPASCHEELQSYPVADHADDRSTGSRATTRTALTYNQRSTSKFDVRPATITFMSCLASWSVSMARSSWRSH